MLSERDETESGLRVPQLDLQATEARIGLRSCLCRSRKHMKVVAMQDEAEADLHASCCGAMDESVAGQDRGVQLHAEVRSMQDVTGDSCKACIEVKSLSGKLNICTTSSPQLISG